MRLYNESSWLRSTIRTGSIWISPSRATIRPTAPAPESSPFTAGSFLSAAGSSVVPDPAVAGSSFFRSAVSGSPDR
jgi:hypothetical protein